MKYRAILTANFLRFMMSRRTMLQSVFNAARKTNAALVWENGVCDYAVENGV
jgi:hypothetical protein